MPRKLRLTLTALLLALLLLTTCSLAEEIAPRGFTIERLTRETETPMGEANTWTIFMYVCGTDLESDGSLASINLWQIMDELPDDNVNVIIQTGGTEGWGAPVDAEINDALGIKGDFATRIIDPDKLQRYRVTDTLTLLDERELASMGHQETLYDFLSWGVENYPADKMGVVFWNHGGGPLGGVCFDEMYDGDSLLPFELENAFTKLYGEMTDRFEFIGFDACLMATVEYANTLAPFARYMYASQEVEDGFGWNYKALISTLNRDPSMDGEVLGQELCDGFFSFYRELDMVGSTTLSVVDLEKTDALLYAIEDFALALNAGFRDPALFAEIARSTARSQNYYYPSLMDLGDLAEKLAHVMPKQAEAILAALDDAVLYNVNARNQAYSHGLSIYNPAEMNSSVNVRSFMTAPTPAWRDYVLDLQHAKLKVILSEVDPVSVLREPEVNEAGDYTMQIDPATLVYVRDIGFQLFVAPEGSESTYLLGVDNDMKLETQTGILQDNFEGKWAHLDGQPLMIGLTDYADDYSLYQAPILLNGQRTNLMLTWTWDESLPENGSYEITGTYSGVDPYTGMASRDIRQLRNGDTIVPLYGVFPYDAVTSEEDAEESDYLDEDGNMIVTPGKSIVVNRDTKVTHEPLDADRYLYQFWVTDVYGIDLNYTPIAFMIGEDGEVVR